MKNYFALILLPFVLCGTHDRLETCLDLFIKKYFEEKTILFFYLSQTRFVMKSLPGRTVYIYNHLSLQDNYSRTYHLKSKNVILFADNANLTSLDGVKARDKYWGRNAKIVFIISNVPDMLESRDILWSFTKSLNVIVMTTNEALDTFNFYTWYPYKYCDTRLVFLKKWIEGEFVSDMFPKRSENFNGCPLKVGYEAYPPFVLKGITYMPQLDVGFEYKAFESIANKHNFTMEKVPTPAGEVFWSGLVDGVITGASGLAYRDEVDLAFSGLMADLNHAIPGDVLMPYMEDEFIWAIPRLGLAPKWRSVFAVFPLLVWCLMLLFYILMSGTLYILCLGGWKLSQCFFYIFRITLGNCPSWKPSSIEQYMFISFAYFYCTHMSWFYTGAIIEYLVLDQHEKPVETFDELCQSTYHLILLPALKNDYEQPKYSGCLLASGRYTYKIGSEPLREIANGAHHAVFKSRAMVEIMRQYLYLDSSGQPKIIIVKQEFMKIMISSITPINSPLYDFFNGKVQSLVETGLVDYWIRLSFEVYRKIRDSGENDDETKRSLTLENVQGIIFLYALGIVASSFTFVIELLTKRTIITHSSPILVESK